MNKISTEEELVQMLKSEIKRKEKLIKHQQDLIQDLNRRLSTYEEPQQDDALITALRERIEHFKARVEKRDAQVLELTKCFYKHLNEQASFEDAVDLLEETGDFKNIDGTEFLVSIILELGQIVSIEDLKKMFNTKKIASTANTD